MTKAKAVSCILCRKLVSNLGLPSHVAIVHGDRQSPEAKAASCVLCRKRTSDLGLAAHYGLAHGDRPLLVSVSAKGSDARRGKPSRNRGKPTWNSGLTKATDPRLEMAGHTISKALLESEKARGWHHTEEMKIHLGQRMNELYATGWEPVCGRAKKYDHDSPIAGKIKVDGTWELTVARYLDLISVTWRRNRERFPYIKPDGKASTYQPDFYVEEWGSYIEVKGYQTELDDAKWAQFPHKLVIWKRAKIEEIGDVVESGLLRFPAKEVVS